MRYTLLVTGPAYGTQHAKSALLFARELLLVGHQIESIFFYREGVLNANEFVTSTSDEFDLVRAWKDLHDKKSVSLKICITAAMRRGIINKEESIRLKLSGYNLQSGFKLSSLLELATATLMCDRVIQF